MIRTRIGYIDDFLGGGLPDGVLVDIFGPSGSGKTSTLHRIAAQTAMSGRRVSYIDATGNFRPERILDMGISPDLLTRIDVLRALSVDEQTSAVGRVPSDTDVLLVDGISDLFIYEYPDLVQSRKRGYLLMQHMRTLSEAALCQRMPIVVTNMIRYGKGGISESMEKAAWLYSHVRVYLTGAPRYEALCSRPGRNDIFSCVPCDV